MKKTFYIKKYFLILVAIFLICTKVVSIANAAEEQFKNNLLKMDVYKTALGELKVTLYTTKPYTDPIVVNKKSDTDYVILMPETSNSLTAKPSLTSASDMVKNVEVRTQQYAPGQAQRGYTKVIFSTSKPVSIITQVQTLNKANKLSDKDYNELLTQAAKKPAVKKIAPKTTAQSPAKPKTAAKVEAPKTLQQTAQNAIKKITKTVQTAQKPQPKKVAKIEQPKPIVKKPVATVKLAVKPAIQKEKIAEPVAKTVKTDVEPVAIKEETLPVATPIKSTPEPIAPPVKSIPKAQKEPSAVENIKTIVKENLYPILGAGAILILLILLLAKKATQKTGPQATPYSEPIEEDEEIEEVDWKEKLKKQPQPEISSEESQDLDGLFSETEEEPEESTEWKMPEIPPYIPPTEKATEEAKEEVEETFIEEETSLPEGWITPELDNYSETHEVSVDELFGNDDIEETLLEEIIEEEAEEFEEFTEANYGEPPYEHYESYEQQTDWATPEETVTATPNIEGFEELEQEFIEDEEFEELQEFTNPQEVQEIEENNNIENIEAGSEDGDSLVLSSFVIDDTKGFYLVDVEDTTALVGYINEDIFVLKRFEENTQGAIQARLNEKKTNLATFMVKVNGFKGMVEVTPSNMKLLIEL